MQCYYEVLGVPRDADATTIKKAHRKLAVKLHPDKNLNDESAADKFRTVQEAYECLSDAAERKWYDEHREAMLKGWSPSNRGGGDDNGDIDMHFDVTPFMSPRCYHGYDDNDPNGFYAVYASVFAAVAQEETDGSTFDIEGGGHYSGQEFGDSTTDMQDVIQFYQIWENFNSSRTFAWADQYDYSSRDGDGVHRRVRRAMEEENKKARKIAKKARNEEVLALVHLCKRRDPRIKAYRAKMEEQKAMKLKEQKAENIRKKKEQREAREKWREEAQESMAQAEEEDRLAGRVRLADLEDDYDYGGGKKKGRKNKKKNRKTSQRDDDEDELAENDNLPLPDAVPAEGGVVVDESANNSLDEQDSNAATVEQQEEKEEFDDEKVTIYDEAELESIESESEEEPPDFWRCECCRKDFKSDGQLNNHMKSKKHKEAFKKYQKKLEQQECVKV